MTSVDKGPEDLELIISKTLTKAEDIVALGSKTAQWGQNVVDLAHASGPLIHYPAPDGFDPEAAARAWSRLSSDEDAVLAAARAYPPITASASGAAFAISSYSDPMAFTDRVPPSERAAAVNDAKRLEDVLGRMADADRTIGLMREYELGEAPPGKKSAIEQLIVAHAVFEAPLGPDNPAIASLLPAREAINLTIAALLRRRRRLRPGKTTSAHAKITSISAQLGRTDLDSARIEQLALEGSQVIKELAASKDRSISRDEWRVLLLRATLFIKQLLDSLDPGKLRN